MLYYKQYKQLNMPRTEHLNSVASNRIYALDAQVLYMHSTGRTTTAIIEQDNSQAKIKIPTSLLNAAELIREGATYHFGHCYVGKNGWISVRNPANTIEPRGENAELINPMSLSQIANNSINLSEHYLSTLLLVVSVKPTETVVKDGKNLTLCILNCFADGYQVDVTLWNSDLPMEELAGKWMVFSGFRLKKLVDWKFVLVSSVYSKMAPYDGQIQSLPYNATQTYHNLSCIFEPRTLQEHLKLSAENDKCYSSFIGRVINIEGFNYQGCSECHRKLVDLEVPCGCSPNSKMEIFLTQKITVEDENGLQITLAVFDAHSQEAISSLAGPTNVKINVKSLRRILGEETVVSYVACKVMI